MDEHPTVFCIRAARGGGPCGGGAGTKCGRWNPTSEQVKVLTDLFKSGLRTPTTEQIQKISSQLSSYGKIESKNVFYWFQNHKARERQKRRRVLVEDGNDRKQIHGVTKYTSTKHFCEPQPPPSERVIETLQLFPLNSFCDSEKDKIKRLAENCKENALFACNDIIKEMDPPKLDLQLSFIYNISNGL